MEAIIWNQKNACKDAMEELISSWTNEYGFAQLSAT